MNKIKRTGQGRTGQDRAGQDRTGLLLGTVEEKGYYRRVEEHSRRHRHLGESRVDMIRLTWIMWGR